jgi:thiol-disulfide isomerase/thioredoxin
VAKITRPIKIFAYEAKVIKTINPCFMKKRLFFFTVILTFLINLMPSCTTEETMDTLTISVSKNTLVADGFDDIKIKVTNQNEEDFTSRAIIYANAVQLKGNAFATETPGSYRIIASRHNSVSDTVLVEASNPGPSPFTKKILVEDYTGTWCGHCPRVIINLDNFIKTNPNCIFVGVHNGAPFTYQYEAQMRSMFDVSGFPYCSGQPQFQMERKPVGP